MTKTNEQPHQLANSIPEAAGRLRVSVPYVRLEISRGNLKVARLGRRVLTPETSLLEYLDDHIQVQESKGEADAK
jgi:excisionase family DNA binding protein